MRRTPKPTPVQPVPTPPVATPRRRLEELTEDSDDDAVGDKLQAAWRAAIDDDETPSVVSFESHASSSGLNDVRKNLGGTWPGPTSSGGGFARAPLDERRAPLNLSALQRSQAHGGKLLDLSDESGDSD